MYSSLSMAEGEDEINRDKKREALIASLFDVRLSGQRGFGLLRDLSERRSVVNGQIGQHLSVYVDRCFFQAVHEYAVAHSQFAHRSVDARNPQRAEFTLFLTPVAILV